jgi:hypothetical protein
MSYKPAEAKAVSTSFQGFLWSEIGKIREAENEGDILTALNRACSLVKYLPVSVKEQLQENVNQISELVNKNFNIESSDFQSTMLLRNKQADSTAHVYLKAFMNKLMRLLDERGVYMEYHRKATPSNISNVPAEFFEQQPPEVQQP